MSRTHHRYARGDLVVVVDCADLERAARFWAAALGYVSQGGADGARYRSLLPPDRVGAEVLLQRTADAKHGKNRVHLDLRTRDLEAEVSRRPRRQRVLRPPTARGLLVRLPARVTG